MYWSKDGLYLLVYLFISNLFVILLFFFDNFFSRNFLSVDARLQDDMVELRSEQNNEII